MAKPVLNLIGNLVLSLLTALYFLEFAIPIPLILQAIDGSLKKEPHRHENYKFQMIYTLVRDISAQV